MKIRRRMAGGVCNIIIYKNCLNIRSKAVEFNPDEYKKFKYCRKLQKSYVPTPPRVPCNNYNIGILPNCLNKIQNFAIFFIQSVRSHRRDTRPNISNI